MKSNGHKSTLIDEGLVKWRTTRLDCNAAKRRSSLGLIVQSDVVFIMFYDAHRPKNIVEGHRNMMTKGDEVSKECFLRRRVFVVKEMIKNKMQRETGYHTTY